MNGDTILKYVVHYKQHLFLCFYHRVSSMSPSKLLQAHSIFKMVIDHDIMHPALVDDDDDALRRKTKQDAR